MLASAPLRWLLPSAPPFPSAAAAKAFEDYDSAAEARERLADMPSMLANSLALLAVSFCAMPADFPGARAYLCTYAASLALRLAVFAALRRPGQHPRTVVLLCLLEKVKHYALLALAAPTPFLATCAVVAGLPFVASSSLSLAANAAAAAAVIAAGLAAPQVRALPAASLALPGLVVLLCLGVGLASAALQHVTARALFLALLEQARAERLTRIALAARLPSDEKQALLDSVMGVGSAGASVCSPPSSTDSSSGSSSSSSSSDSASSSSSSSSSNSSNSKSTGPSACVLPPAASRDMSVVFVDIAGFDALVQALPPGELVELLHVLWERVLACAEAHGVRMIEVSGGSFVGQVTAETCARGSSSGSGGAACHASAAVRFGLAAAAAQAAAAARAAPASHLRLCIGVASGPAYCGLLGSQRVQHVAVGDVVNSASRMAALAPPGQLRLMAATAAAVARGLACSGQRTEVKGLGAVDVYTPSAASAVAFLAAGEGEGGADPAAPAPAAPARLQPAPAPAPDVFEHIRQRGDSSATAEDLEAALAASCGAHAKAVTGSLALRFADAAQEARWRASLPPQLGAAACAGALGVCVAVAVAAGAGALPLRALIVFTAVAAPLGIARMPQACAASCAAVLLGTGLALCLRAGWAEAAAAAAAGALADPPWARHPAPGAALPLPASFNDVALAFMTLFASARGLAARGPGLIVVASAAGIACAAAGGAWPALGPLGPLKVCVLLFGSIVFALLTRGDERRQRRAFAALEAARASGAGAVAALDALLPRALSARLRAGRSTRDLTARHASTALLLVDVVGFTTLCRQVPNPHDVFLMLNAAFREFERAAAEGGAYKVKSIGDSLLFAMGLELDEGGGSGSGSSSGDCSDDEEGVAAARGAANAAALLRVALHIQAAAGATLRHPVTGAPVALRAGLHLGSVVGGAVQVGGAAFYDLFGEAVEAAKRAEGACPPGAVLATPAAAAALAASGAPGLALAPLQPQAPAAAAAAAAAPAPAATLPAPHYYAAALLPDVPVWSWDWDVLRLPLLGAQPPTALYGRPVGAAGVVAVVGIGSGSGGGLEGAGAQPPPPPRPRAPPHALCIEGEARLAAAALALLRGPRGDGLSRAGVPDAAAAAFIAAIRATHAAQPWNPFHNWYHVVSVLHATALVLNAPALAALPPLLRLAGCAAALGHDAGHPGTTNAYETRSRSRLAAAGGGSGPVLERHHIELTLGALESSGVLGAVGGGGARGAGARASLTALVRAAIMATDMGVHDAVLASLSARAERCRGGGAPWNGSQSDAEALVGEVLHATDLSAAAYARAGMQWWAAGLYEEFGLQPAREAAAGLEPGAFFLSLAQGGALAQARAQVGFVRGVVRPLWAGVDAVAGGALAAQLRNVEASLAFHEGEVARLEDGAAAWSQLF